MIQHYDLTTTYQEADVILVQQCHKLIQSGSLSLFKNISNGSDMFGFACSYFPKRKMDIAVLIETINHVQL